MHWLCQQLERLVNAMRFGLSFQEIGLAMATKGRGRQPPQEMLAHADLPVPLFNQHARCQSPLSRARQGIIDYAQNQGEAEWLTLVECSTTRMNFSVSATFRGSKARNFMRRSLNGVLWRGAALLRITVIARERRCPT